MQAGVKWSLGRDFKMAEANKGLELLTNWCKKSGLSCSFFIFSALNIAMVVIGADALNLCTVQPMIPIYLIGKILIWLWQILVVSVILLCNANVANHQNHQWNSHQWKFLEPYFPRSRDPCKIVSHAYLGLVQYQISWYENWQLDKMLIYSEIKNK